MRGILVKTGKYRSDIALASSTKPDLVLDTFAELLEHF
jgi:ribonucleotide monophosphatase NagD (HAD superfamily)